MDFSLTEEQELIRSQVRQLADSFDLEYWREHDRTKVYPQEFLDAFAEAGCDVLYGDLIFGLGMPVAIRSLPALGKVGRALLPAITKLPFKWLYPTGSAQEESSGRHGKWFAGRRVVAGDFHYIRRHAPPDLSGVVVVTNTTTEDDVRMLRERGVEWLVTTTPRLEGRSFGANVMEALFFALEGRTDLRGEDYHRLAAEFGFGGSVERLQ